MFYSTVLIQLSGLQLTGCSLIRTVSVTKKLKETLTLNKNLLYDTQMSAEKHEKTIKQLSILSYFSKTSNEK